MLWSRLGSLALRARVNTPAAAAVNAQRSSPALRYAGARAYSAGADRVQMCWTFQASMCELSGRARRTDSQ